jgi:tetratricopeptide (TPR) repeat protein
VDQPSPERWLRVARWQQWSRNFRASVDAAQKALAIAPNSVEAHDFLARLHASDPSGTQATQHLRELAKIDLANRLAYLRRLGHALMQSGQTEEALRTFRELAQENPGDIEMLHDLALAQQRAELWQDSLATLRQIYQVSPAPRKREAVTALLRVFERMNLRQEAADLLIEQIDRETDDRGRFALFHDLLNHCTRHGLLDWLRDSIERRSKQRADDYFSEVALGRVLKAQGNKAAAFEVLADAAFSAPNPAEALPELVREAEELRRLEAAIALQSRLVRMVPQTTPEGLERLAQLQEKALQPDEAAQTWSRLLGRFPRDVQVLEKAAEFERVWGSPERAIGVLRRLLEIEPENLRALTRLAELSLEEGNPGEAAACLEKVLAQTTPEKPGETVLFPAVRTDDPARLEIAYRTTVSRRQGRASQDAMRALRTFWFEKPGETHVAADRRPRLETIRDLARIYAARNDPAQTAAWIARWQAPEISATEKLWALYFSGASGALLDEVEKLVAAKPQDGSTVSAFVWLALQTGEFERLAQWTQAPHRTPPERDFLLVALEQHLDDRSEGASPALIISLFPEGHRVRLWQMASAFAQRGLYREAIELGRKVFEEITTQKAVCGVELAQWHLALGEIEPARAVLRESVRLGADHLGAPHFAALRALHQLLPEAERARFEREHLDALDDRRQPLQATLTRMLFAALDGDHAGASSHLGALLGMRPIVHGSNPQENSTPGSRYWDFVLLTGAQLMAWSFDRLAAEWWTRALSDEAAIRLQRQLSSGHTDAVQDRVNHVRTRLAAARLLRADAFEFDAILRSHQLASPPEGLLPLAEVLESTGAYPAAVAIYRKVWSKETANPHALRNALSACRTAQDWNTLEAILQRVVAEGYFLQNDAAHRDLVLQLVDVLARRGDLTGARALLLQTLDGNRNDARAMLKLGELHHRAGDPAAAEAAYHKLLAVEPANIPARLALASLLEESGRATAALDVLERAGGTEIDGRLALLSLKLGRLDDALATLDRIPETDRPRLALEMADLLADRGDALRAVRLLRATLGRTVDPRMGSALQKRLIEMLPVHTEPVAARREFRRLQQFLDGSAADIAEFFDLARTHAARFGIAAECREELLRLWAAGKGEPAAGAVLLAWALEGAGAEDWRGFWTQLCSHPGLDAASVDRALRALDAAGEAGAAVEAHGILARLDPSDPQRLIAWARAAARSGDLGEALRIASELRRRGVFSPEVLPSSAALLAELGDRKKALEVYSQIVEADPTAHRFERYIEAADLLLAGGRHATARRVLLAARRNPATPIAPALARYFEATGQLEDFEPGLARFDLPGQALAEFRREIFHRLLALGRLSAALTLASTHRELLDAGSFSRLREAARNQRIFEPVVALLDQELRQNAKAPAGILAALLADWADAELESLQVDAALGHLARAHLLDPASWRIADQLSSLHLERGEAGQAAQVLRAFLSAASEPDGSPERERATQRLARIPGA